MRQTSVFVPIALLSLSSGCDFSEEIWIREDGTARLKTDLSISERLLAMYKGDKRDPFTELEPKLKNAEEALQNYPGVNKAEFKNYSDSGMRHYVLDIELDEYRKLPQLRQHIESNQQKLVENVKISKVTQLQIEPQEKSGNLLVQLQVHPISIQDDEEKDEEKEKIRKSLTATMVADHYYTITLRASRIISSDGQIQEGGDSAAWKLSLGDLMTSTTPKELNAEIQIHRSSSTLWILSIATGVVLVGLTVFVLLKNSRP